MSMFRNLLKLKNNSGLYIRLIPEFLNFSQAGESKQLAVESNGKWTFTFEEKSRLIDSSKR